MKVSDILDDSDKTRFSLEVYPPKAVSGAKTPIQFQLSKIFETVERLIKYSPAFVSVTYNPEGKTKETSIPLAAIIRQRFKVETVAHLTCIATTKEDMLKTLDVIDYFGIKNILALRGDIPERFKSDNNEQKYASNLVEEIVMHKSNTCIGVACYPEGHVECLNQRGERDLEKDLFNFKLKVEKGADFAITQLFFENRHYFDFVERVRKIGINVPIIPGIFPIFSYRNIQAIAQLSGASIPNSLRRKIEKNIEDPQEIKSIGIEHAVRQCKELIHKVLCIHFYTMDKWESVEAIVKALGY
jgi:methylenetetrahydrofolate reductase (NADPH)